MREANNTFELEGINIHYTQWTTNFSEKPAVICHGVSEHSGCYSECVDFLCDNHFSVYGYDHIGHGKSGGKRGYIKSFSDFIRQIEFFIKYVYDKEHKKITLVSHSMGGLITLHYLATNKNHSDYIEKLIFSAPAVGTQNILHKPLEFFVKQLSKVFPTFNFPHLLSTSMLTRDPIEQEKRKKDELILNRLSLSLLAGLLNYMDIIQNTNIETTLPTLALIAGSDKVVNPQKALNLFNIFSKQTTKINI